MWAVVPQVLGIPIGLITVIGPILNLKQVLLQHINICEFSLRDFLCEYKSDKR